MSSSSPRPQVQSLACKLLGSYLHDDVIVMWIMLHSYVPDTSFCDVANFLLNGLSVEMSKHFATSNHDPIAS